MQCKLQDSLVDHVPDSQDVGSGAAQEVESVADTSDWCSGWTRSPQNSWYEEEKSTRHVQGGRAGREGVTGGIG